MASGPKISIFLRYTHITPIFWGQTDPTNGILSPPYPEVTLDNFRFPVGGRSAARRAVFQPPGRILARKSVFCYWTPDFVNGPFVALAKTVDLAPLDRFLKFSFPSYGRFREGDPSDAAKSLPPPHCGDTVFQ